MVTSTLVKKDLQVVDLVQEAMILGVEITQVIEEAGDVVSREDRVGREGRVVGVRFQDIGQLTDDFVTCRHGYS